MHILQYIAVQAISDDEAMQIVEDTLNNELGSESSNSAWFDWFVIGGGRFVEGNPYASSPNHIISYRDKPEEFRAMVDSCIVNRKEEFDRYRETFEDSGIDLNAKLDNYTGNMEYNFDLYPLGKMIDMIYGEWDFNSYFYDMEHMSTNTSHMYKAIDLSPDLWYLIPVDFHF